MASTMGISNKSWRWSLHLVSQSNLEEAWQSWTMINMRGCVAGKIWGGLSDTSQKIAVSEIRVALSSKLSSVLSESAGCFVFRHPACKLTQLQRRFGLWHSNIFLDSASSLRTEKYILVERSNSALAHFFYWSNPTLLIAWQSLSCTTSSIQI